LGQVAAAQAKQRSHSALPFSYSNVTVSTTHRARKRRVEVVDGIGGHLAVEAVEIDVHDATRRPRGSGNGRRCRNHPRLTL
jgi:hypothetical protein